MASFLPGGPAVADRVDDLAAEIVLSLELSRGEGCDLAATEQAAARLTQAYHAVFVAAEELDRPDTSARVDDVCRMAEHAYAQWKTVDAAFAQTTRLAYANIVPRSNLALDDIHAHLKQRVGERVAEVYTSLRARWASHVAARPWDTYLNRVPGHVDQPALEQALSALARGDELDVEDAMASLTGPLRHVFAEHIAAHPKDIDDLEVGLWRRPEFLVAGDYWGHAKPVRLLDVLGQSTAERTRGAAHTLSALFAPGQSAHAVARAFDAVHESQRDRIARCLMLHPDYEVRRFVATGADINSIWKVVTPENVPCATILSLLERLVGSSRYTTAQRKIFFDAVYRRLLSLTSRSDVLYARGIVRIFVKLNFFLEDGYFARLTALLDYVAAKESAYGMNNDLLKEYMGRVRREKERVGSVADETPGFDGVPLVVLRKLARDGHFWDTLVAHPIAKIARETVPHASTRDRALLVAGNHRVNPEVLRGLGRKRDLFASPNARTALLSNPQTPVAVSMNYLSDLSLKDVEALLRRSTVHPEFRNMLRTRYEATRR